MLRKRVFSIFPLVFLGAVMSAALVIPVRAQQHSAQQNFPNRPVRFVVPYAPGGSADTLARTMGTKLADSLGQQVVVDNRPGANGDIGMQIVARAPADGHTIVLGYIANLAIFPGLSAKMPYDPQKDFAPITQLASSPNVMTAHPSVPAKSLQEFIALARAKPGQYSFASAGVASVGHLTGELIGSLAGVKITHVPYKGSGQAVTDLLGGHVHVMFSGFSSTLAHIKAGKLRALAQTGAKRSPALADVPTIAEQGFPGVEATAWYGVLAPAGAPKPVISRLNAGILAALKHPEVTARLGGLGFEIVGSSPEAFAAYIRSETVKWAKVVKASGAKAE
ncbi:MAG: tripartite tricarboxylate transporter substrate binding protein [Burkholderiales bacterium]|nr:tripartite tricarboxylate transporter substrate binding protein [Burkholderiales bacterium]